MFYTLHSCFPALMCLMGTWTITFFLAKLFFGFFWDAFRAVAPEDSIFLLLALIWGCKWKQEAKTFVHLNHNKPHRKRKQLSHFRDLPGLSEHPLLLSGGSNPHYQHPVSPCPGPSVSPSCTVPLLWDRVLLPQRVGDACPALLWEQIWLRSSWTDLDAIAEPSGLVPWTSRLLPALL